jgi:uncharacterized protein YraI
LAQPELPGDPGPQPTTAPGATATPVTAATAVPTREILSTAVPCGEPPTVQVLAGVNVRTGPGTAYDVQSGLLAGEVRPIKGRAAIAQWWLIELAGGGQGWVADRTVTVHGYTGNVPLVPAPAVGNATPTPGPTWQPTANPACIATATPTATPRSANAIQSVSGNEAEPTATTVAPPPQVEPTETVKSEPAAMATTAVLESALPTAAPLNTTGGRSSTSWILYAGLGLLLLSGVAFVAFGRRG